MQENKKKKLTTHNKTKPSSEMLPLKGNSACKVWQEKEKFHFSDVPDDNWETSPVQSRGWDGINCFFQGQVDFCIEFF